jgi:ubiquinone/menaquinone biosynthesis C-methylase UbiE
MSEEQGYVLGQSEKAARRLAIQDAHFAEVSEQILADLALRPNDRVVELGCGPGSFTRRILQRLGPDGIVVGVDVTAGLLQQARAMLADNRFVPVLANVAELGSWLDGADVVTCRTMLHHIPMVEFVLGRLRKVVRPGTRIGFLEPDFRTPLVGLAYAEANGRPELEPLKAWAVAINQLYQARRISPCVGPTLGASLEMAGYRNVRSHFSVSRSDELMIENMLMFYDEVREQLQEAGIFTAAEIARQQQMLQALKPAGLPGVWGIHRVAAET